MDMGFCSPRKGSAPNSSSSSALALAPALRAHLLRGAMFGRFGFGGGNFVAQYRCYPVSFIDRVRA